MEEGIAVETDTFSAIALLCQSDLFPVLGIGVGQGLRLNAVARPPNPGAPPAGCAATLSFADSAGNVMQDPGPVSVNLSPGQAAFLDLTRNLRAPNRLEARPLVTFPAAGGGADCIFSAEIFDRASGFSEVFINPGPINLPGSPAAFSLMGVAFGQVARLNAVAVSPGPIQSPPGPCLVTLGFADANGNPVGINPGPTQINPGQATFLDLPAPVRTVGQRALVRPVVIADSVPGANACAGVVSLVETFDTLTGRTWAAVNPGPQQ